MDAGALPWLSAPLRHGPWAAAVAAFAVTPGGLWLLALVLERRLPGPRTEFAAVAFGDPLLAAAVGLGVWRIGAGPSVGAAGAWWALVWAAAWLCFGLLQWRGELRAGFFTRQQACAPTKIWHQLVVYPLLGFWLWRAGLGGLLAPGAGPGAVAGRAGIVVCVSGWALINVHDRRRPKLGHPPYDWRRLRPFPQPWPPSSRTLRAYRAEAGEEEDVMSR